MSKAFPVHPYLFAIFPILSLFSNNIDEVYYSQIVSPILIALAATLFIVWMSGLLYKKAAKSAIIASIFVILFFSYGHIHGLLEGLRTSSSIGYHPYLLVIWTVIFLLAGYFLKRTSKDLSGITGVLNIAAVSLVIMSLLTIGTYEFKHRPLADNDAKTESTGSDSKTAGAEWDIYYIILDGYARADILNEIYGYDNSGFIDHLTGKGFHVSPGSHSNYSLTFLSLASSLNMEYINHLTDTIGIESKDRAMLYKRIKNNKAADFLKSKGYMFFHFGSGWGATKSNSSADADFHSTGDEFQMVLIQTTMLSLFEKYFNFNKNKSRNRVLHAFTRLAEVPETRGPTFTFAHFILPHPPYLFGAGGEQVPEAKLEMSGGVWKQKENYVNQLIFTNKKVQELVDEILRRSEISPIIILQGDHGSASTFYDDPDGDGWNKPSGQMLKERMGIFSAYYLPDGGDALLAEDFTPVNTFRLIFNHYFGANYQLLGNQIYYSTYNRPYQFINVTDTLRGER